jgi:DNA polymerase-1
MPEKHLYLIDGHALAYRSYYATIRNPLINSKGIPTGAVFGAAMVLLRLIEKYQCPYLAMVFDSPKPTFRHEMYAQYKANREEMPDDLKTQMPLIFKVVDALNIPLIKRDGYEADDILAHLTRKAVEDGFDVSIVTKDKDLMQLVGGRVRMLSPEGDGVLNAIGPDEVARKMGVPPDKVRDLLALTGDASDNVPGVPGVGPKTAIKILEQAGTVQRLLDDPSCIDNPKVRAKIEENRASLMLSRDLVTLKFDVPVDVPLDSLAIREPHRDECIALFRDLEFKSLLKEPLFETAEALDFSASVAASLDDVRDMAQRIQAAGFVSIDTETTSTVPREARLVGISLSVDPASALYVPVGHADAARNLPLKGVLDVLRPVVESASIAKIGQNLKYDCQIFRGNDCVMRGIGFDTMVAGYLIDPGKRQYSLDAMAADLLGAKTTPIESLIGKGKEQKPFSEVPVDVAARYSGEDVVLPLRLREKQLAMLDQRGLVALFNKVEIPLITALAEMEWQGILIDAGLLTRLSKEFHERLGAISRDIYALAGLEFNLNSTQQVADVLFNRMALPKSRRTKTGLSTDIDALEKLAPDFPIAAKLINYREVQKLLSTYVDALPEQVSARTGRVHTSFNQTVTATGRLSSTNPNLQNIPVRTDEGRRIREAFIASPGHTIISADYSQIELRILAHVSQDATLLQAFRDDQDIHARTAAAIYGIFPEMVTPEMRRAAKTINFGLMYGMGPVNLSRQLAISFKEAQDFIDAYFNQFPSIKTYMSGAIDTARARGYAETLLGRRRYLPEINAESRQVREAAERTAINTPIQGTAADIIKIAMVDIERDRPPEFRDVKMLLQVHDELVFEAPDSRANAFADWAAKAMSKAFPLDVPVRVDAGMGANWSAAH